MTGLAQTPLMVLSECDDPVASLLSAHADINARDSAGRVCPAAHAWCCAWPQRIDTQTVLYRETFPTSLLYAGADLNLQDHKGNVRLLAARVS